MQLKLSIIWTVTLSPFWIIGGLAVRSLALPEIRFKVVELPEVIVVALIINVYVAAPVFAETIIFWSWQNVLEGSLVDKLISKESRLFIVTISSPIKVHDVVIEEITTFLLKKVVVVIPVGW